MKVELKHWMLIVAACLLIVIIKMCKTEQLPHKELGGELVNEVKQIHNQSDSLLDKVLYNIKRNEKNYNNKIDSLNQFISKKKLSQKERGILEMKIKNTQKLLERVRARKDTAIFIESIEGVGMGYNKVDSIIYNIIERDSIVYNIIERDSIVYKTFYKIDTICYESSDIKKLRLKK